LGIIALLIVSLAAAAFADTIRLKDGSIIKGRIVTFAGGRFVVTIGDGSRQRQMTFTAAEIESIQFDALQTYAANNRANTNQQQDRNSIIPVSTNNKRSTDSPAATVKPEVRTSSPAASAPVKSAPVTTSKQPPVTVVQQPVNRSSELNKPVELNVAVLADNTSNGWTNSGWVVRKGQRIHITGEGQVSLGKGTTTAPEGRSDLKDEQKLMKGVPTGALIAVIGDDNNDFIYVGGDREFTATRDGALFLGVNEGNLNDNSGSFAVKIQITPENN
jgi:hypothetical protein